MRTLDARHHDDNDGTRDVTQGYDKMPPESVDK